MSSLHATEAPIEADADAAPPKLGKLVVPRKRTRLDYPVALPAPQPCVDEAASFVAHDEAGSFGYGAQPRLPTSPTRCIADDWASITQFSARRNVNSPLGLK